MSPQTARLAKLAAVPATGVVETSPDSGLGSRLGGLAVLAALLTFGGMAVVTAWRAATDAWVAPLQLSPDNDSVMALRLNDARYQADVARAEAEVSRIDGDLAAIGTAIDRLSRLDGLGKSSVRWQAGEGADERRQLEATVSHLSQQRDVLTRLHARQQSLTGRARADREAGLIDRTELERQEQALDALEVQLLENRQTLDATSFRLAQLGREAEAFKRAFGKGVGGRSPVVAAGEEHSVRVEVELVRLESERRGLEATRRAVAENLSRMRELLEETRTRPLYRAMTTKMDVAFVPYSQLQGVDAGARVMDCLGGLVKCRDVGRVAELLPGEVVTQDPWGNPARGQYAVLALEDASAIREKVLRLRAN